MPERISARALEPADWQLVEELFGANGACGGCWCMHWRMPKGVDWPREKGERNQRALRRLVSEGRVHAALAFAAERAVGWCCFGPRVDFDRLERSRVLRTGAPPETWAVVCFFVPARWRGKGVASALLARAVSSAREGGARALEGFPVQDRNDASARYPATFAYTGVPRLFERAGFRDVTPEGATRLIYRRDFRRARAD